jgi:hypothetical protein
MTDPVELYEICLRAVERAMNSNTTTSDTQLTAMGRAIFGSRYLGTFQAKAWPIISEQQPYAIVNTHDAPGEHWLGLFWTPLGTLVYDSFGRPTRMIMTIRPPKRLFETDDDAEQALQETNCGQRCIAFLWVCGLLGPDKAKRI